jgi:SpoVK/Ycf46/Vps4 family AAA+-type ATPase
MLFSKSKSESNYKFNSLKTYAWDRTIAGKKKFRRVFEKSELTYLSVELSLFNKLFDEEDWEAEIHLIANKIEGDKSKKICEKKEKLTITQTENIYKYSFGWGNDKRGDFWSKGIYQWEAFLDGELVSKTKFYIEDSGMVKLDKNPYLTVTSLNTYEAPQGNLDEDERVYLKSFNLATTRYIMGELKFSNQVAYEWYCELLFNIYDDTGMFIGCSDSFSVITPESGIGEIFTVTSGWGAAKPGSWIEDNYTMEVVFMDQVIAVIPFSIGKSEVVRLSEYEALLNEDVGTIYNDTIKLKESNAESQNLTTNEDSSPDKKTESDTKSAEDSTVEVFIDDRPLAEILSHLDRLIGLENIKMKVREYIDYVSFLQIRAKTGIEEKEEISLHSVFTGNPGTGKTTVVKLLGKIFKSMGLLSKGHVHIVEANDLISGYIRQTGKDTKKAIEDARGGILFIDEAYMLYKEGASNDFGPEAVAALITEMSDGKGDIAIMVAGYPKEMESFIESNPGLKSRFKNYFHFEDYTPEELMDIAAFGAKKKGVTISKDASTELKKVLTEAYRKRDRTFGNARFAHAIIDEAKMKLGIRLMKDPNIEEFTKTQLSTLEEIDIQSVVQSKDEKKLKLDIDESLLKEALEELNTLTGLTSIKEEVRELIKLCRYYKENKRDILKAFSMHSVFTGNPGTGKTTVARIIAKIYKALGMLERGHLIDADGSDLEAGFLGQTAIKTKELIGKSIGGILFIDEAYSITEGRNTDFGKKAIAALIKEMEDHRGEFGIIVAGYTQNMEEFLKANPGLKSRFDQQFHFNDFSQVELWEIAENMFASRGLKADGPAKNHIISYLEFLYSNRDRFFGNARSVRKIVEKASRNQELRMADLTKKERTKKMMSTIMLDDVKEFVPNEEKTSNRKALGFRIGK